MSEKALCRHCNVKPARSGRRGLCYKCERTPEIAAQYPSTSNYRNHADKHETLADLEALIAERLRPENLPSWWNAAWGEDVDDAEGVSRQLRPDRHPMQKSKRAKT